jgi:hypothetical protein
MSSGLCGISFGATAVDVGVRIDAGMVGSGSGGCAAAAGEVVVRLVAGRIEGWATDRKDIDVEASGGRRKNQVAPAPSSTPRSTTTPRTSSAWYLFLILDGGGTHAEAATALMRRVISAAGSDTGARATDSAGAASKTSTAAAPAEGRAAGLVARHAVRTSTSRRGVSGANDVRDRRTAAGTGAAPVRQNQPIAAIA